MLTSSPQASLSLRLSAHTDPMCGPTSLQGYVKPHQPPTLRVARLRAGLIWWLWNWTSMNPSWVHSSPAIRVAMRCWVSVSRPICHAMLSSLSLECEGRHQAAPPCVLSLWERYFRRQIAEIQLLPFANHTQRQTKLREKNLILVHEYAIEILL